MNKKKPLYSCDECDNLCKLTTGDYFMVKHEIWDKHGNGKGILCWKCLERRMGREITRDDLLDCPLNTMFNIKTIKMLAN